MNCLRRCADACCRASFFLLFSFLLLFRTVFCFCFLVQNYLRQQPLKSLHLVNVLDLFHAAYTYSMICLYVCVCSYKSLYVFVSLVFNTFIALCVFFSSSVRSLSLSLSLALFCDLCSQKTQHILCFVLLLSVRVCRRLKTG